MASEVTVMVPYRVDYQVGGERRHFSVIATDADDAYDSVRAYLAANFPSASIIGSPVLHSR